MCQMLCTLYLCEFSLWNRSLCETPSDGTLSPFLSRENWGAERLRLAWGYFPTHRVSYTASTIFLAWPLRHHPLWFQVSSGAAPSQYHVWLLLCLLLSTCSHVPQPSPSYLHRTPRSSHLISWQLTPSTPGWVCSSNCLLNTLPSCLRISQT